MLGGIEMIKTYYFIPDNNVPENLLYIPSQHNALHGLSQKFQKARERVHT